MSCSRSGHDFPFGIHERGVHLMEGSLARIQHLEGVAEAVAAFAEQRVPVAQPDVLQVAEHVQPSQAGFGDF